MGKTVEEKRSFSDSKKADPDMHAIKMHIGARHADSLSEKPRDI